MKIHQHCRTPSNLAIVVAAAVACALPLLVHGGSPAVANLTIRCIDAVPTASSPPQCQPAASSTSSATPLFGVPAATITNDALFQTTGWNGVTVEALSSVNPALGFYAAGFAEGYATQYDIHVSWANFMAESIGPTRNFNRTAFFTTMQLHYDFLSSFSMSDVDPFRRQVARMMWMLQGLADGYNASWVAAGSPAAQQRTRFDIFLLNLQPEIGEWMIGTMKRTQRPRRQQQQRRFSKLEKNQHDESHTTAVNTRNWFSYANGPQAPPPRFTGLKDFYDSHCSVLIRNTGQDLFVGHTTWWGFASMYRQAKTYRMEGTSVTFSSYPGFLSSMDDFYFTSKGLIVTETTLWIFNTTLYEQYLNPNTVSEFIRVMSANFLANTSTEWIQHFSTLNSGTYCSQYMAVDTKLYTPGQPVPNNTLWVAEQLPGSVTAFDMSSNLNTVAQGGQGYWASYNVPSFDQVYLWSGDKDFQEANGFSPDYGRRKIFAVQAPLVTDLPSMQAAMRYNNYLTDPLSFIPNCTGAVNNTCAPSVQRSSWFAISSRGDLAPFFNDSVAAQNAYGNNWPLFNGHLSGGTDGKITSWSLMRNKNRIGASNSAVDNGQAYFINGPSTSGNVLPPFRWSNVRNRVPVPPLEHPDLWNFSWVQLVAGAQNVSSSVVVPSSTPASTTTQPPAVNPNGPAPVSSRGALVAEAVGGAGAFVVILIIAVVIFRVRGSSGTASRHAVKEEDLSEDFIGHQSDAVPPAQSAESINAA